MTPKYGKRVCSAATVALVIVGAAALAAGQAAPTILTSPAETPGQFTYAFVDPAASERGWVAIDFHRNPDCSEISGFNLLLFVDFPNAFGCRLTVAVTEWWNDDDLTTAGGPWQSPPWAASFRSPRQALWREDGTVPIYFVRVVELLDAIADDVLSVDELKGLPSLRVGSATQYLFVQLNSGRSNSFPTLRNGQTQTTAQGVLENGGSFQFSRNTHGGVVTSVKIDFK